LPQPTAKKPTPSKTYANLEVPPNSQWPKYSTCIDEVKLTN
jgi:hypothetical protein